MKERLSNSSFIVVIILLVIVVGQIGQLISSTLDARKLADAVFAHRDAIAEYDSNFVSISLSILNDTETWLSLVEHRKNPALTDDDLSRLAATETKVRILKIIAEASDVGTERNKFGEAKVVGNLEQVTELMRKAVTENISPPNKEACPVPPGVSCLPPAMVGPLRSPIEGILASALRLQYKLRAEAAGRKED